MRQLKTLLFTVEVNSTASTPHGKLFSSHAANSVFSFDVVSYGVHRVLAVISTPPKSVL